MLEKRDNIPTYDFLRSQSNFKSIKSICDLGSGVPIELFRIINSLNKLNAVAVDKDKIPEVDKVYFEEDYLYRNSDNHEKLYELQLETKFEELKTDDFIFNEYIATCLVDNFHPKNRSDFNSILNKDNFDTPLLGYLEKENQRFDLIIMSKVLSHDLDSNNHKLIIDGIKRLLNKNGQIFIRLNYKGYCTLNLTTDEIHKQIENTFEIIDKYEEVISKERSNLIYFGKRKN